VQRFLNNPRLLLVITAIITAVIVGLSVFPGKFPSLQLTNPTNIPIPGIPTTPNVGHSVVAASQRPNYSLTLIDSKGLMSTFDYLKIWGKTYKGQDTAPLNSVIILLTDKPQPTQKDVAVQPKNGTKEKFFFSYNVEYKKDFVVMTVYLSDSLLRSAGPSQAFGAAVVYIASTMNGMDKNLAQIPNSSSIGGFFKIQNITVPSAPPSPTPTPTR